MCLIVSEPIRTGQVFLQAVQHIGLYHTCLLAVKLKLYAGLGEDEQTVIVFCVWFGSNCPGPLERGKDGMTRKGGLQRRQQRPTLFAQRGQGATNASKGLSESLTSEAAGDFLTLAILGMMQHAIDIVENNLYFLHIL